MWSSGEGKGSMCGTGIRLLLCASLVALLIAAGGCPREPDERMPSGTSAAAVQGDQYIDFKEGPDDAPVKVVAFYPGRHEDTLAAVKALLVTFEGKVQVEIVDWRHEEGMERRDAAGLTCAGVTINGKSAFDLEVDGQQTKVLFERGIDGEWTNADLEAAVRQELEAVGGE